MQTCCICTAGSPRLNCVISNITSLSLSPLFYSSISSFLSSIYGIHLISLTSSTCGIDKEYVIEMDWWDEQTLKINAPKHGMRITITITK